MGLLEWYRRNTDGLTRVRLTWAAYAVVALGVLLALASTCGFSVRP